MSDGHDCVGFVRYVGPSVAEGYLDARKSAEALLGLDEAVRYFVGSQSPDFGRVDYEIPVRIERGSWQALIPHDIPTWVMAALGSGTTAYFVTAATKMAENDFDDVGLREIFKKALQAIQWTIRIWKPRSTGLCTSSTA